MFTPIAAGLILGLMGSLHCVGMCGPLSLALPVHDLSPSKKATALALYHFGRISVYALLGLAFGLAGRGLYLAGMQQKISIVLGIIILLAAFQVIFSGKARRFPLIAKFNLEVQTQMVRLLNAPAWKNYLFFGALNGLLPCGMVYVAIAGAVGTNNVLHAVLFMGSFGFATVPAMFALGFFGYMMSLQLRNNFRKLSPYVMGVLGIILVLRGLNLGIPFISPVMQNAPGTAISCH